MPSSDGQNKVKLNVRVPPDKKEEWKQQLEAGQTMSSVVRDAVERELSDEYVHKDTIDEVLGERTSVAGSTDVDLSAVTERLDELQGSVDSLHREMNQVATADSTYDQDKVSELAMDLMEYIPPLYDTDQVDPDDTEGRLDRFKHDMRRHPAPECTVDGIAKAAGEAPSLVRRALLHIEQKTTSDVGSVVVDGKRYWARLMRQGEI